MSTTIEEVEVTAPKRKVRAKDKTRVPVPSGPTSVSPGVWLTEAYASLNTLDPTSEHFRLVQDIVDSYRPGPRYRRVWLADGDEDFLDCGEELETKATCYGEADIAAIRKQAEDSPSFTMMGTPGVLAGVDLLMFREQKRREHELEDYTPKPKRKTGKKAKKETPKPTLRRVTMNELESLYNAWFDEQTENRWTAFCEACWAYFHRRATHDSSEDGRKLREAERDTELVNEFLLKILAVLKKGRKIDVLENYLNRAWKRRRIDALRDLKEWDRKHVRDVPTDDEADEDERATSYTDAAMYQDWQVEQRETPEPTEEEREQDREIKFSQLDPDLQDFAGVLLTGASEKELSIRFDKSRQWVGRTKRKVERQLRRVVTR